jgi:hypothetical protein
MTRVKGGTEKEKREYVSFPSKVLQVPSCISVYFLHYLRPLGNLSDLQCSWLHTRVLA